jgi:putative endonuclease
MPNSRSQFGKEGESIAAKHLKKHGYRIISRNYRTKVGEIDIIAKDKGTLVFVEVKTRRSALFGNPKWAVTPKKQMNISKVALCYLKETDQCHVKARFDVVAINSSSDNPNIEIIKNAFELAYT